MYKGRQEGKGGEEDEQEDQDENAKARFKAAEGATSAVGGSGAAAATSMREVSAHLPPTTKAQKHPCCLFSDKDPGTRISLKGSPCVRVPCEPRIQNPGFHAFL